MRRLTYAELDCPRCVHTYGSSPCEAEVGVTGPDRCKNTANTCQDLQNYDGSGITTVRWVISSNFVPPEPYAVPNMRGVDVDAQRINPGENLGKRERVTCSFANHAHGDTDLDPYVNERAYNPYEQGSYWGKFQAMWPNVQGYPFRIVRGAAGQPYEEMERSHYMASKGELTGDRSGYQLVAKDVLDHIEGNKSLCPLPSEGTLASDISAAASSVTLAPAGIGSSYPESFEASIGDEAVRCTRSGDVVTFTERGALFTVAEEHSEGDTLQVMASFIQMRPDEILEALLQFTELPAESYDVDEWAKQSDQVFAPLYTGYVAEPTEVFKLVEEIMVDFALGIYSNVVTNKVVMEYLVRKAPSMDLSDGVIGNPEAKFFPKKRVDVFYIAFGRRNPLEKMDEPKNYPTTLVRPSSNPRAVLQGNPPAIRSHFSRWIPGPLRPEAGNTAKFIVGRYELAPRGLACTIKAEFSPRLAQVVNMKTSVFEDEWGGVPTIPMQVVKRAEGQGNYSLELEEFRAAEFDPDQAVIVIALDEDLLNTGDFDTLRDLYNFYRGDSPIPDNAEVRFEANPGVVFGSQFINEFAVDMGDWPEIANGVVIRVFDLTILGEGGVAGFDSFDGGDGGPALTTTVPVEFVRCEIGGGGGGGAGARFEHHFGGIFSAQGGGGAGRQPGSGFNDGTDFEGGDGENNDEQAIGGNGGDIGQPGKNSSSGQQGGAPGLAVDGFSLITLTDSNVYGPTQN